MKRIVCLLLAVVLVLALAGCRVSSRPYRRYATPYVTDNVTNDTTTNRTYRTNLRPRTINPGDAPLYDGSLNRSTTRRNTTVTTPASPLPTTTSRVPGRNNRTFNVPS